MTERAEQLRRQILDLAVQFHAEAFPPSEFKPGESSIPVSGKVIDGRDLVQLWIRLLIAGSRPVALRKSSSGSWRVS